MDIEEFLSRFAVALGIGLLIGLERGWRTRDQESGARAAGIRTFAITGLLGGTTGALALALGGATSTGGGLLLGLGFAAYSGVIALFSREENRAENTYSATTAIAAMVTFALGACAVVGDMAVAGAAAVATACVLALRENLHGLIEEITWPELRSTLVLLAMTFIILPVVPDDPIGPFGGVNPRQVWLIAIVLAAVSFVGYVAVRSFGERYGILLASAAGGLVSSTALTAANAKKAASGEGAPLLLAAGVALATAISFARVIVIVAVLKPILLPLLAPALLAAVVVAAGFALVSVYWRSSGAGSATGDAYRNPFGFGSVVSFALLLGAIIVVGRGMSEWLGPTGTVIGAAALGLADVDAVTVSMAKLAPDALDVRSAAFAILAAVLTNTLTKIGIGAAVGRGIFAFEIAMMSAACILAGGAALWVTLGLLPI